MLHDHYQVEISDDTLIFTFVSIGSKGSIKKIVRYTAIEERLYNMGFGDKNPLTNYEDDLVVTNNDYTEKVLATVAITLYYFISRYPNATVLFTGSTESRNRLYRIGISNNLEEIGQSFVIFGLIENSWEPFRKDRAYRAFFVHRKFVNSQYEEETNKDQAS